MKMKTFKKVVGMAMALSVVFCASSCYETMKIEDDGIFEYTYLKEHRWGAQEDAYAIVGTVSELPEVLYIPPYYKGKEMRYIYYEYNSGGMFSSERYGLSMQNVQTAYIPYTSNLRYADRIMGDSLYAFPKITYIVCSLENSNYIDEYLACLMWEDFMEMGNNVDNIVYLSSFMYKEWGKNQGLKNSILSKTENGRNSQVNQNFDEGLSKEYDVSIGGMETSNDTISQSGETYVEAANTSYMFNYAEAPNNNYFFINDFEYGGKIENAPYEPLREGYTFGGWYKEAGCTNAWDFEEDTLPVEIKDEEGETVYQETKLYAKWYKK